MDYLLCHQMAHILQGDIWREPYLKGDVYHHACDVLANILLDRDGWKQKEFPHLGTVCKTILTPHEKGEIPSAMQIYWGLPYRDSGMTEERKKRDMIDSDQFWKQDKPPQMKVVFLPDQKKDKPKQEKDKGNLPSPRDHEEEKYQWAERIQAAARAIQKKNNKGDDGTLSSLFMKRYVEKRRQAVVDWKTVLHTFIQEEVCDYSFSPPDRRFSETDFFLPDYSEKDQSIHDVLFMADTSGSMKGDAIAAVYSEICGAVEQFHGKLQGYLGFFDEAITPAVPFETVEDVLSIIPYGGGGTDFHAVFSYAQTLKAVPSVIVILTDGYGEFPSEEEANGIPVLWVLNNLHRTPPWGRIARIVQETNSRK